MQIILTFIINEYPKPLLIKQKYAPPDCVTAKKKKKEMITHCGVPRTGTPRNCWVNIF